jgi:hypothetical protein
MNIGFEVLTAVVMKSDGFWGVVSCGSLRQSDFSEKHVASIFGVEE